MREAGIDLSALKPQLLTEELAKQATLLVTMGCGDACPFVPGFKKIDWDLRDPKNQSIVVVRQIRDQIYQQVFQLVSERNWAKP